MVWKLRKETLVLLLDTSPYSGELHSGVCELELERLEGGVDGQRVVGGDVLEVERVGDGVVHLEENG